MSNAIFCGYPDNVSDMMSKGTYFGTWNVDVRSVFGRICKFHSLGITRNSSTMFKHSNITKTHLNTGTVGIK